MPLAFTDTDFQQFSRFDRTELLRLYDFLIQRLPARPMESVISIRVTPAVVEQIRRIAVARQLTRSDIARQAIIEFTQRNPL